LLSSLDRLQVTMAQVNIQRPARSKEAASATDCVLALL
jgi:hypothetical protein